MIDARIRDISFLQEFQNFYSELIRLRQRAELGFDPSPFGGEPETGEITIVIWTRLADLLDRQARLTGSSAGDIGHGLYREAQYVMAALADEIFLNIEWDGKEYWTSHLLESHLFNSNVAGEEFFSRLDRLLREPERGYTDIYAIYLMALSLGFRGKYRGHDDGGRIEEARRALYVRIYHRKPELLRQGRKLFPECYAHTLDLGKAKKLPAPARWFWSLAAAIVIWLGISTLAWQSLSSDLHDDVQVLLRKAPAKAGR